MTQYTVGRLGMVGINNPPRLIPPLEAQIKSSVVGALGSHPRRDLGSPGATNESSVRLLHERLE